LKQRLGGLKRKSEGGGMEGVEGKNDFFRIFARWTFEEIVFIEKSF
jgi:hypothetical protein